MPGHAEEPEYVLGRSEAETQRLIDQARFVRPSTERVFRKAGITAGMRILDLGCGAGDVSLLAAELVGPTGSVVGIDVDPCVLSIACRRARDAALTWVRFEERPLAVAVASGDRFDAVVGRFILMYQPDPIVTLLQLADVVRPGGLVVLQEPDFGIGITSRPTVPLWKDVNRWIAETFERGGVHHDIGGDLYPLFRRAGLPGPSLLQHISVAGGSAARPFCENAAALVRSLLPRLEKLGVATAAEVSIETLADRLERETIDRESQISYLPLTGAWTSLA